MGEEAFDNSLARHFYDAKCRCDFGGDQVGIGNGCKVHKVRAISEMLLQVDSGLHSYAGLAHPSRSRDR